MSNTAALLAPAGVPAFKCPQGTKMHILNLGILQVDEGWCVLFRLRVVATRFWLIVWSRLLRGSNTSSMSNKNPENKRRDLVVLAGLIDHPDMGLILFETGCAENLEVVSWRSPVAHSSYPDTAVEMGCSVNRRLPEDRVQ